MHDPNEDHMNEDMGILCYLKSTPGKGLLFKKHGHADFTGYTCSEGILLLGISPLFCKVRNKFLHPCLAHKLNYITPSAS